jgi:hypothetical protein
MKKYYVMATEMWGVEDEIEAESEEEAIEKMMKDLTNGKYHDSDFRFVAEYGTDKWIISEV